MSNDNLDKIDSLESLLKLQKTFAKIIRKPLIDNSMMQSNKMTDEFIKNNENFSAHERLQFYSRQYWWRIQGAFDEDFISVKLLAGKKKYLEYRDEYLLKYPSISFTLRNLGSRFPEFMKAKNELLYNAALYDFARVEAFDFGSLKPLKLEDCQKEAFESAKLTIQPHVRLLSLKYPINKIRDDFRQAQRQESSNVISKELLAEDDTSQVDLNKEDTYLALHRVNGRVFVKSLSSIEFRILSLFQKESSILSLESDSILNKAFQDNFSIKDFFKELMALKWLSLV